MEDGKNADTSATVSGIFCELCSLEFTAKSELEEHSWSLLHNTTLNRKKGRDCIHQCSLCNQSFVGLLDFTSHIHGENHQENIHKWRKEQHEDKNHNENGSRLEQDWTTDDVSKVLDSKTFCQENTDVPIMADYYGNQEYPWGIGGPPTAKRVQLKDLVRDERITEFGLRYQDQLDRQPSVNRDLHTDQIVMNESRERVRQWDKWHHPHQSHHQKFTGCDEREYTSENGNYGPDYPERDELNHSYECYDPDQRPTSSEGERYDIYYSSRKEYRDTPRNRGVYGWSRHHKQRHGKPGSGCKAGFSRSSQEEFARDRPVNRSLHSSQQGAKEYRRLPKRNKHASSRDSGSQPGSSQERRYKGDDQSLNRKTPDQVKLSGKVDPQKRSSPRSRSLQSPAEKPARKNKPRKLRRSAEKKEDRTCKDDTLVECSHTTNRESTEMNRRRSAEKKEDRTGKDDTLVEHSHTTNRESTELNRNQTAQINKTKKVSRVKEMVGKEKAITYETSFKQSGDPVCTLTENNSFSQEKSTGEKDVESRNRSCGASSTGGKVTAAENHDQDFGRTLRKKEGRETVADRRKKVPYSQKRALSTEKKEIVPPSKSKGPVSQRRKVPMDEGENVRDLKEKGTTRKKEENFSACRKKGELVGKIKDMCGPKDMDVSINLREGSSLSCEEKGISKLTPREKENFLLSVNENSNVSATNKEEEPSLLSEGKTGDSTSATKGKILPLSSPKEKGQTGPLCKDKENHLSNLQEKRHFLPVQKETLPSDASTSNQPVDKQLGKKGNNNSSGNTLTSTRIQSEETLRSLLGIKKEPLDFESEEWPPSSTTAAAELNKPPRDCSSKSSYLNNSGIVSPLVGLYSPSVKVASSRLVPVLSQISLSRPQCSFVHIDGVQCSAVTWNKYCSYHQRIEEEKNPGNSVISEGSCRSKEMQRPDPSWKSPFGRGSGTRIFRPQMPPLDDLPVGTGTAAGNAMELSQSSFSHSNDVDETAKDPGVNNNDAAVPSGDIDLNSTLPTARRLQDSAMDANLQREIYLSDTVPRPGRPLSLQGSSRVLNSSPSIDLSQTVPGRNTMSHSPTFGDGENGSQSSWNPTVQKYARNKVLSGQSTGSARGPEVDISEKAQSFAKSSTLRKAIVADNDQIIDLNQTVPRAGRIVLLPASSTDDAVGYGTDLNHGVLTGVRSVALPSSSIGSDGNSKVSTVLDLRSNLSGLASSRLQSDFSGEDAGETHIGQRSPGRSSCNSLKHSQSSNPNTEMIDLNFSTKLLGIPHSVGGSFSSASNHLPKTTASPLGREGEHSSSDFVARSPGYYNGSSPQSPLSSRPSTGSGAASPGNLSLDLSRFNLPPAVRQALAERYNTKSQPNCVNPAMSETGNLRGTIADGRRSQPLFAENAGNEVTDDTRKTMSSLPRRLRCHRSVSLDSPINRNLDKGGVYGATHLIVERKRNLDSKESQYVRPILQVPSASAYNNVPGGSSSSLTNVVTSTVDFNRLGSVKTSHGVQRGGLIDLSATTYLDGISEASRKIDSQAESTTSRVDQVQSPERHTVLSSQGLIDLNSTASFTVLGSAAEKPSMQSIIKRKRLSSREPEGSLGLSEENLVKRRKHDAPYNPEDTAATYQAGLNVQELLTIERDEEEQLQALHDVQSNLKSVRAQIQKLCTELDALHSEENRISVKMGELRNLRLRILENACYEKRRRASTTRVEIVPREPAYSRTEIADRTRNVSVVPETNAGASNSVKEVITTGDSFAGNFSRPLLPKTLLLKDANPFSSEDLGLRSDYEEKDMEMGSDIEQMYLPAGVKHEGELHASCSIGNVSSNARASGGRLQTAGALEANHCRNTIKQCEIPQPNTNPSNRALEQSLSSNKIEVCRMVTQTSPSGNKPKELDAVVKIVPHNDWEDVRSGAVSDSEGRATGGNNGQQKELRNVISQTKSDLGRKIKHLYRPEKSARKKSFSDVNVSKTIEASRKKIQSVKENMKRWKKQEEEIGNLGRNEGRYKNPNDSSSAESNENSVGCLGTEELAPASSKSPDGCKSSPRKTTKELKKSSLFQSRKKTSRDVKDKSEATHARRKSEETEGVPCKKRKIDESLINGGDCLPAEEQTTLNEEGRFVNAITHTIAADLEGSGTENTTGNGDEIPTRDMDTESEEQPSCGIQRVSHLQIPSSTVESLKKSLQKGKVAGQNSRGPTTSKFSGHTGAVCGLKVHNGCLFACSADKTTRSFDLQTGECAKVYLGHHQAVNCLEILPDQDRLFTGSNDQTVRSYNIKSGVCSHKFTFDGRVMCLHAGFGLLFVGLSTGIVASIDVNSNKCLERLHCHEPRGVSCLTTATEGQRRLLCTGSFDSTITIRDFKTGLLIRTLSDHVMTVLCLQVVENVVYSGSADMKVQAHNLNTGELLRCYLGHSMSVSGLQIVGRVLVTACLDKLVRCYDLMSAELLQVYGGQMDMIFSVHVNSGKIYSGARDGSVTGVKLDLRVYHPCKWTDCQLNFGIVSHLRNHLREYHVMEQGTVEACHWAKCGHQFSAEDDIKVVLRHVLGHVVSRSARKSVS